jgi:hypothetical protein
MASFLTEKTSPLLYEVLSFVVGHALALPLALDNIDVHGVQIAWPLWVLICTVQLEMSWGISLSLAAASLLHTECCCEASAKRSSSMKLVERSLLNPRCVVMMCGILPFEHGLGSWPLFVEDGVVQRSFESSLICNEGSKCILLKSCK